MKVERNMEKDNKERNEMKSRANTSGKKIKEIIWEKEGEDGRK